MHARGLSRFHSCSFSWHPDRPTRALPQSQSLRFNKLSEHEWFGERAGEKRWRTRLDGMSDTASASSNQISCIWSRAHSATGVFVLIRVENKFIYLFFRNFYGPLCSGVLISGTAIAPVQFARWAALKINLSIDGCLSDANPSDSFCSAFNNDIFFWPPRQGKRFRLG